MTTWARHLYENEPLAIAKGESNGCSVRNIFGYQEDVGNSFIPAWEYDEEYVYPSSAVTMTVTSDDSDDDNSLAKVIGLDENYDVISEDVIINTSSPNTTTQAFFRINDVIFYSRSTNQGLITVSNGGTVYGAIREGDGRNQASIYTVPRGYDFYLYRLNAYSADSNNPRPATFRNFTSFTDGRQFTVARTTFSGSMDITRVLPFKYEGKTDIQFQVRTKSGTHEVATFGEGVLIKHVINGEP